MVGRLLLLVKHGMAKVFLNWRLQADALSETLPMSAKVGIP